MGQTIKKIAVIDTTFARVDMGAVCVAALHDLAQRNAWPIAIQQRTVPGFKDLAVACYQALEDEDCTIAMAMGWVGGTTLDAQCGHEAATAIAQAQLMAKKHILEVFIHEQEATAPLTLIEIARRRVAEHAANALFLIFAPERLSAFAGTGRRQGGPSVGRLEAI